MIHIFPFLVEGHLKKVLWVLLCNCIQHQEKTTCNIQEEREEGVDTVEEPATSQMEEEASQPRPLGNRK
jgi:hypothetical protein